MISKEKKKAKRTMLGKWLAAMTILMGMVLLPATVMAEEPDKELWVNGENILEAENNTVSCGEGTASYDPSKGCLTLENAVINTGTDLSGSYKQYGINAALGEDMNLSLRLIGNNVFKAESGRDISGIFASGSIDIQGEGSLNLETEEGFEIGGDLILTDVDITLKSISRAVYTQNDIIIKDSKFSVMSKDSVGIYTDGSIKVESGKLYVKAEGELPALMLMRYKESQDAEPSANTVFLAEGYGEINGGTLGIADWSSEDSWTEVVSFVAPEANGKLAEDLSNAMKEITIDKIPAPVVKTGEWEQDNTGRRYKYSDGSYPVSKWELIDNHWYYFNDSGYAVTGWLKQGNTWYYLNGYGTMATGWYQLGGKWYYSNTSGAMQTGWLLDGNTWYYLKGDGSMATGWYQAGGKWYYLKASGAMQTGWLKQGSIWYYLKADGAMATGWYQDGKTWYYSNGSGVMQTGWLKQGTTWYYLKDDGAMAVGWYKTGGAWYYFKANGVMATGWNKDGNTWYYLNPSGSMAASRWIGNYYVGSSGDMYVSRYTPDGYYVDRNGKWMKLGEDDIDFDLDRVVTKYFYMRVPESWDEPAQYGAIDKMWIAMYANAFKDEDGEDDYEPLFGIVAAKTEAEAKSYMAELKNPKNLGKHSGFWFVAGQDKETEISKYPQEQQAEILQMQKDIPAILNSIVFR